MREAKPLTRTVIALWGGTAVFIAALGVGVSSQLVAQASPEEAAGSATELSGQTTSAGSGPGSGDNGSGSGNGGSTGGGSTPASKTLVVTGAVRGAVAPGVTATLVVTVQNPNSRPVVLRTVSARVTEVSSGTRSGLAACDPSWFSIGGMTAGTTIARGGSTTVDLPIAFANTAGNQDNCKGVDYWFSFSATADQA